MAPAIRGLGPRLGERGGPARGKERVKQNVGYAHILFRTGGPCWGAAPRTAALPPWPRLRPQN